MERRSLFLMSDTMYKTHLHGIEEITSDTVTNDMLNLDRCTGVSIGDVLQRSRRVSLTIRYVPKVIKMKLFFGKRK